MTIYPSNSTLFGLLRHAPTIWNEQKRIQGRKDSPLSPQGRALAQFWGEKLCSYSWNRILCSDLERVLHTAELVNRSLDIPLQADQQLREQDWGVWTGMTLQEVKKQDIAELRKQEQMGWDFRPPEGESRREVLARALAVLNAAHTSWPGESILVPCHEGVIKCLLYHLLGRSFLPEEPKVIKSYNLHLLRLQDTELSLEKMNHLSLSVPTEYAGE